MSAAEADLAAIDGRSAARGSVALLLAQLGTRMLQIAFVVAATRAVGADDFGRFSVAAGMFVLGGLVADLGTSPALVRLTSREPGTAPEVLGGTLVTSFLLGLASWAAIASIARLVYDPIVATDVAIVGLSLPFFAVNTSIQAALDGVGRIPLRAASTFVQPVIAAGVAAVVCVRTESIRPAIWCMPAGVFAATLFLLFAASRAGLLRAGLRPSRSRSVQLLRLALPFAAFSGLGSLSARFDLLLLGAREGTAASASYDLALRTCETLWYVHTVVTAPTMVLLSSRLGSGDESGARRAYEMAIRLSYLSGFGVALVVVMASDPIVDALGGATFADASIALAISGAILWLGYVTFVQGVLILAGNHLRAGLATACSLTVLTMLFDIGLIVPFGVIGAACAAVLGVVATAVGCDVLHRRTLGWPTPLPPAALVLLTGAALGIALPLRTIPLAATAVAVAIYGAGLFVFRIVTPEDIRQVRTLLRRAERSA